MHDWEADPRPLAEALHAWMTARNGGVVYGARAVAAQLLREKPANIRNWLDGKPCSYARLVRRAMTLIDKSEP